MSRRTFTSSDVRAGCFACRGSDVIWTSKNALALAARHHDSTGHQTWAEQTLSIRYGDAEVEAPHPDMFEDAAA